MGARETPIFTVVGGVALFPNKGTELAPIDLNMRFHRPAQRVKNNPDAASVLRAQCVLSGCTLVANIQAPALRP